MGVNNSDYYSFIYDVEELKFFYENILPPLSNKSDVYFVSLSARNKYLTDEERRSLELGRTEMFSKNIIRKREWPRFLRTIRKFECHKEGYTTKNGNSIPEKCIVCYININPSNTLQAISNFKKVLSEYEVELASIALNGRTNSNNIAERLNKLDNSLMTAYQQSRGEKVWIDIDIDTKEGELYKNEAVKKFLNDKGIKTYYWVDTKSGYHLLIKRSELKFNPFIICKALYDQLSLFYYDSYYNNSNIPMTYPECEIKAYSIEICINKNEMIPLPGTLQGGYPVKVLNKNI